MDRKFVMAPTEPTPEMLDAGAKAWLSDDLRRSSTLYRAMISAAPPVDAKPVAYIRKDQVQQALRSGPFFCRVHPNHDDGFELVPFYFDAPPAPVAVGDDDDLMEAAGPTMKYDGNGMWFGTTADYVAALRAVARPAPADASTAGDPTYTDDLELRYAEVCEERDHLRRALARPAPADASPAGDREARRFFSFSQDEDFEEHDTAEAAEHAAQESIDFYRDLAPDGWPEAVEYVRWGVVLGMAVQKPKDKGLVDYELQRLPALAQPAAPVAQSLDYEPGNLDRTAPARIWLQVDAGGHNEDRDPPWPGSDGVSWCEDSIGGLEIEYVRADLVRPFARRDEEAPQPGGVSEADALDAARYQWLRDRTSGVRCGTGQQRFSLPAIVAPNGVNLMQGSVAQHLDAAIDRQRSQS